MPGFWIGIFFGGEVIFFVGEEGFCEMGQSYYAILGVSADSSDEEIRRAYRKLAMVTYNKAWIFGLFFSFSFFSLLRINRKNWHGFVSNGILINGRRGIHLC